MFWALFGSCLRSECEIGPGKSKSERSPGQLLQPARGGRGCLPRGRGTKRRRRRVEPGILYWTRTKALEPCKRAKRPTLSCAQRGQDGAKVSSSLAQLGENTPFLLCFYPKKLLPPALLPPLGQRDPTPAAASGWREDHDGGEKGLEQALSV